MNIDKTLVQEAKKALGGHGATIIANGININKWNSQKLSGCCPFHNEKTPSFKWDPVHYTFKCFGCGETLDIVEYYMSYQNMTFIEAIKELFKEAGISYDFDKFKHKPNKKYKYPEEEKNTNISKVESYLKTRCISKETIDYAGIKEDAKGNIVFEYKDELGKLLTVKYRPSRKIEKGENKTWCQKDKDTSHILFGMHQIDTTKPLLIAEGEIDRLCCIESGFKNTVSIPFGANNYQWIEQNFEWLDQFEKIYIWFDEDEAGDNARKEVIPRLGEERCWIVRQKYNDINVLLYKEGKKAVMEQIDSAKQNPIPDTMFLFDAEAFDINEAEKIKTPYDDLNKWIGGFVLGTVNIVTGVNSSGKSTLINHMCVSHPLNEGYKVWIYSAELTAPQLKSWIEFPLAGKKNILEFDNGPARPKGYAVKNDCKEKIKQKYRENLLMYSNENNMTSKNILKRMDQLARVNGVKIFLLDNLMMIDLECNKNEELKKQKEFVLDLKKLARKYNAVIHLVAHPRKVDEIKRLSKLDVAGSGDITNLADYVMSVHRVLPKEKEDILDKKGEVVAEGIKYDTIIDLFKNRPLGHQDKAIGLYFDYASKRFYGEFDKLDIEYGWEKHKVDIPEELKLKKITSDDCPF